MNKFIWSKINEDKEVCSIVFNSIIIGELVVDKDIMDNKKWMCYFNKFTYPQVFCFEYKMPEKHGIYNKEVAKKEIIQQFKKIINNIYVFSSQISKQYLA